MIYRPTNRRYLLSSKRGWRNGKFHRGYDYSLPRGTTIYPTKKMIGYAWHKYEPGGFGHFVAIKWKDGSGTWIAHMSKVLVKNGQEIDFNTKLGYSGSSGLSTGPHYHHEEHRVYGRMSTNYAFTYSERKDEMIKLQRRIKIKIKIPTLRVRKKPSTSSKVIGTVKKGETFTPNKFGNGTKVNRKKLWYFLDSKRGWVHSIGVNELHCTNLGILDKVREILNLK